MGIFDKGIDSLKGIKEVAGSVGKTAGKATKQAAESVSAAVTGALGGAKDALDQMATDRLESQEAEYAPAYNAARKTIKDESIRDLLNSFGESPLPLTEANAKKVKKSFPIPREQTVLWADAEFDLRPSGIAMTETGVYVKTDAVAFTLPGKKSEQSRLCYVKWVYFDPGSFSGRTESNLALAVDESHRTRFIKGCRKLAATTHAHDPENLEDLSPLDWASETDLGTAGLEAAAVTAAEALNSSEQVFVEQRAAINNRGGHGELAEEANTMLDKLFGHEARVCGRDNAKNGADRTVDGMLVQTKYHKSAISSLESCFDPVTHEYRYIAQDGTPMQLEVPKDQYQRVLRGFEKKIRQGKVPGVDDPAEAQTIVRKGRLTYEQAVNLTKPGTVESLFYDVRTGVVTCSYAFGLTFLATSFMAFRETKSMRKAIRAGFDAGVRVFGLSFAQHIAVSQLSRTGLSNALMAPSQAIVGKLGCKTSATIVNGLRTLTGKTTISGAAASKQLAKMLRSNAATAAATMVVFSAPETYKLIQGKASGAQFTQNIASLTTSVVGGAAGTAAAGVAAAKVSAVVGTAVAPGVGTVIGLVGGMIGGTVGTYASQAVGGILFEGDAASFNRYLEALLSCMVTEYLLNEKEVDEVVTKLNNVEKGGLKKLIEKTLSAEHQEEVVRDFLAPMFEEVVSRREHFSLPTMKQVTEVLVDIEEEVEEPEDGKS